MHEKKQQMTWKNVKHENISSAFGKKLMEVKA